LRPGAGHNIVFYFRDYIGNMGPIFGGREDHSTLSLLLLSGWTARITGSSNVLTLLMISRRAAAAVWFGPASFAEALKHFLEILPEAIRSNLRT
jgi:hypothetical protein